VVGVGVLSSPYENPIIPLVGGYGVFHVLRENSKAYIRNTMHI